MNARIGVAGWSLPTALQPLFPARGTHLEKYAAVFNCVELNSCFYREHKAETYRRWAQSVPGDFRFSLKLLREFTHDRRLAEGGARLERILAGHAELGEKWGALLVQLPPSLDFDPRTVDGFFRELRTYYAGPVFCEPRHATWSVPRALDVLNTHGVSRVVADPDPNPLPPSLAKIPPRGLYLRMHGSPQIYKSSYGPYALDQMAARLRSSPGESWCIFDNTTYGYAITNAIDLRSRLHGTPKLQTHAPGH